MSRRKGSKNKNPVAVPDTVHFTTEQRLEFIATLIVERMLEDISSGKPLLRQIGGNDGTH